MNSTNPIIGDPAATTHDQDGTRERTGSPTTLATDVAAASWTARADTRDARSLARGGAR